MSRGTRLTALTVALTLTLPMAPAAADRGHQVPDSAVITIKGDGSGHGRGLSQYGAYSAARKGKGYRAILGFYYPKTRWKKAGGSLEVLVSRDDDGDTVVRDVRGLKVRDVAAGRTHAADEGSATRWRIEDDGSGGSSVSTGNSLKDFIVRPSTNARKSSVTPTYARASSSVMAAARRRRRSCRRSSSVIAAAAASSAAVGCRAPMPVVVRTMFEAAFAPVESCRGGEEGAASAGRGRRCAPVRARGRRPRAPSP